ncbi:hypothetical protein PENTCL1PPCAC_4625, partial [Pristionchus entomophagus]
IIPIDWFVLYISYGPCGYFGATACYITTSFYTIVTSLIYRVLVIRGRSLSVRETFGLVYGISLPMPTILMLYCWLERLMYQSILVFVEALIISSREDVRDLMNYLRPEYDADSHVVTGENNFFLLTRFKKKTLFQGHVDIRNASVTAALIIATALPGPLIMSIVYLRIVSIFS